MTAIAESADRNVAREHYLAELGIMASRVVHEIRNPLNAIRMQAAVIRKKLSKPNPSNLAVASEQLELLEQEVLRLEELARAFLEFGRPPADEPELVDVAVLAEEVVGMIRPEFEQRGLAVVIETMADDPPPRVMMDRGQLRQVLHNLIDNAKTAMEPGGKLTLNVSQRPDAMLVIRVCDTGRGILPQSIPRIFEPFYSDSNGSGLGLAIVKRIIEEADGRIHVESQVGRGTSVEITLPSASGPLRD